jgi:ppGpp synthetase/RelA/SpoT-type nucleotidyltranferase
LNKLKSWYDERVPVYNALVEKLENLVKEILDKEAIEYVHIEARLKRFDSFEKKIVTKPYSKPEEVTDLAGVMIVGSVLSNAELISTKIKSGKEFQIDWDESEDHLIKLAEDRVGYRGKNYVAIFRVEAFRNTDEYKKFEDIRFEIQIKTLLDYAWDKIEHNRNYKTAEELPEKSDVRRRFKLTAGALEVVDNEFDRLSKETEQIADPIRNKIAKGDLNVEVSPLSLRVFLTLHFSDIPGFIELFQDPRDQLLDELDSMGINTITDLNEIIKPDINQFKSKYAEASKAKDYVSFSALIRDILIISEPEGYFKKAWKHHYNTLDYHCWKVYEKFEVDRSNFPPTSELDFKEGSDKDTWNYSIGDRLVEKDY